MTCACFAYLYCSRSLHRPSSCCLLGSGGWGLCYSATGRCCFPPCQIARYCSLGLSNTLRSPVNNHYDRYNCLINLFHWNGHSYINHHLLLTRSLYHLESQVYFIRGFKMLHHYYYIYYRNSQCISCSIHSPEMSYFYELLHHRRPQFAYLGFIANPLHQMNSHIRVSY